MASVDYSTALIGYAQIYTATLGAPDAPPTDITPPMIANVTPAPGAIDYTQTISFDITDNSTINNIMLYLIANGSSEVIYDNSTFLGAYLSSSRSSISNGFSFNIIRDGGYIANDISISVFASDSNSNILQDNINYIISNAPQPDITPPIINNVLPADGSTIDYQDSISFDITDSNSLIKNTIISISTSNTNELIYDNKNFLQPYLSSSASVIADGYSFSIRRTGGFESNNINLNVISSDSFDNTLNYSGNYNITGIPQPDITPPEISNIIPAPYSELGRDDAIEFDITDPAGIKRVMIFIRYKDIWELVYDGNSFQNPYELSSKNPILDSGASDIHYKIKRSSGWNTSMNYISLRIIAYDNKGNEVS